jgi:hypothetical protein
VAAVVLVPYRGQPETAQVWRSVDALPLAHGAVWLDTPGLPRARDELAQAALDLGADVALFADSDVEFSPEAARAVCFAARETRGVAGVAFASSNPGAQWNVLPLGLLMSDRVLSVDYLNGQEGAPFVDVDAVGFGLTAVHVDVFAAIASHFPELKLRGPGRSASWFRPALFRAQGGDRNVELGEDWSFCHRAVASGFRVVLVQSAAIGHRNVPAEPGRITVTMRGLGLLECIG